MPDIDESRCRCIKATDIGILQVRVDTLAETLSEVKNLIKRIEESVGIVRIVQVHSEQHAQDYARLTSLVHSLSQSVSDLEDEFHAEVTNSKAEVIREIKTLEDTSSTRESHWREKYNTFRGIVMGLTLVTGLLSGIAVYMAGNATTMITESYQYILQLKTIDALDVLKRQIGEKSSNPRSGS